VAVQFTRERGEGIRLNASALDQINNLNKGNCGDVSGVPLAAAPSISI
jgi:hypothetical protein